MHVTETLRVWKGSRCLTSRNPAKSAGESAIFPEWLRFFRVAKWARFGVFWRESTPGGAGFRETEIRHICLTGDVRTCDTNVFVPFRKIETALGGLIAASLLFSQHIRYTATQFLLENVSGHAVLFTLSGVGLMGGVLVFLLCRSSKARLFLKTLRQIGNRLLQKPFWKQWLHILVSHVLLWLCLGTAFFLFVQSLTPVPWAHAGILIACYAFAWLCGFLRFLTPGGLGVREGLLSRLLAHYLPASQATLVALLCRLWMLSVEIVLAGVAFFLEKHRPPA